jgi:hypothetical protein
MMDSLSLRWGLCFDNGCALEKKYLLYEMVHHVGFGVET